MCHKWGHKKKLFQSLRSRLGLRLGLGLGLGLVLGLGLGLWLGLRFHVGFFRVRFSVKFHVMFQVSVRFMSMVLVRFLFSVRFWDCLGLRLELVLVFGLGVSGWVRFRVTVRFRVILLRLEGSVYV